MAGVLELLYSALVLIVAVAGIAYVLWMTESDEAEPDGPRLGRGILIGVVVVFLAAMILGLVV